MYELTIDTKFSAAHQLRGYQGRCEKLHGHNWKVEVSIEAEVLNEIGLALDFKELKDNTNETLVLLEHSFLNEVFPFTELNPTSENIAKWLFDGLSRKMNSDILRVSRVTIWESDTARATYYE
jgi:6-pyruvoyltetrahydropterin/6-carboxytetrahydropterin synthase